MGLLLLLSIAAVATVSVAAAASAVVGVHLMFGGLFSTIVEISHSSVAVKLKQSWQSF